MSIYVYSGFDLDRIHCAILLFICNLDIFIWSQKWYFRYKITDTEKIGQCDVKHIMMLQLKTITSALLRY